MSEFLDFMDKLVFGYIPYIALTLFVFVSILRYITHRYTYTTSSSQFLETSKLFWGSVPWPL